MEASINSKGYFGMAWLLNVILAIIPLSNVIFGIVIRAMRGNILGAILNLILCPIFYVIDLITIIFTNDLKLLAK
ncbi:MAG: hypothetical protein K2I79_03660 [Clostridia bacterium]|nr:hypothetical protein [Clostridia bacterium]